MSAATVNSENPLGGAPLSAEARLNVLDVTLGSGTAQTTFTVAHGSMQASSKVVSVIPVNSAATALGAITWSLSSGTGTFSHDARDVAGTEEFIIAVLSQV